MSDARRITNSEVKTWKRCRRKWYLGQFRGLRMMRENPVSAAKLGTVFHDALAAHYDPNDPRHPLEVVGYYAETDVIEAGEDASLVKKIRAQEELVSAMVEGYLEWLQETGEDEDLEVVSVESSVEVPLREVVDPLGRPVTLLGKKDLRVRNRQSGLLSFMDHKSVDDFSRINLLHLDVQMKLYVLLDVLEQVEAGETPVFTEAALYNMARKVKRSARAKPPFFMREPVRFNAATIRSFWRTLHSDVREILAAEATLSDGADHRDVCSPNPTRDCSWECPFLAICGAVDEDPKAAEAVISSYYEVGNPLARYAADPSQGMVHSSSATETEGD